MRAAWTSAFMQKWLVVGCGYLGRELARSLHTLGHTVSAWTSSPESAARESVAGFRVSPVDIRDLDWVRRVGERDGPFDGVINCVSSGGGDAARYREIYWQGTANLLRSLCFDRFFYTSSTSVYGKNDGGTVDEVSPPETTTATGLILRETEDLVLARRGIVTRLSGIYGPGRCALLQRFLTGESTLDGDGGRWLNTIERDDAVAGILTLIEKSPASDIFNLTDDGGITQLAAFQFLAAALDRPLPPSAPPNPGRKRGLTNKQVSNARLRQLGWEPRFPTFLAGLQQLLKN